MMLRAALILLGGLLIIGSTFFFGASLGFGAGLWTLTVLIDALLGFLTLAIAFEASISNDIGNPERFTLLSALGGLAILAGTAGGIALGGAIGLGLGLLGAGLGLWLVLAGIREDSPKQ